MRTFISITLPLPTLEKIKNIQIDLQKGLQNGVSWISPNSIHLTLKFLGDTNNDQIAEISAGLREICTHVRPFMLTCGGLGCFPDNRHPSVIWVGIARDNSLNALVGEIEELCYTAGFPREKRMFSPHLTLGRIRTPLQSLDLEFLNNQMKNRSTLTISEIEVDEIDLMKSDLQPKGAIYSLLNSFAIT
jgi:RNA 2',3'-cyclic 3'-phosphodiesterase